MWCRRSYNGAAVCSRASPEYCGKMFYVPKRGSIRSGNTMRAAIILTIAVLVPALLAGPAPAANQQDVNDCKNDDPDRSIAGCTRLLNSSNLTKRLRAQSYYNRGLAWHDKGEADRAIADFTEAIRVDPKYEEAYNNRGGVWDEKREYDRAIADFNEAIRLNPNATAYYNRGGAWKAKGEFDRAIGDYDQVIKLSPNHAAAYNNRALIWRDKYDFDRAIADFGQAIRLAPKWALPYNNRGNAFNDIGEFDRAIMDFNEAIRINPKFAEAYIDRGNSFREMGQFETAISDSTEAIRLNPKEPAFYNNRGLAFCAKGELDLAIYDYDDAIRLDPKYTQAYFNRGEAWRLKGDLDRAVADQDEAIRIDPSSPAAYVTRGTTFRYRGEFGRALADYDEGFRLSDVNHHLPGYVPALTGRGLTYEKMGDLAHARIEFQRALASQHPLKANISKSARETAQARLAALNSGVAQPIIPAAPAHVASTTSVPTPAAPIPAISNAAIAQQGRRVALVIGNSAYKNVDRLTNPTHDAEAVANRLRGIGFQTVTVVHDTTSETLLDALRTFAAEADKADWAMVYYAGHGIEVGGVNYLIPVEAKLALDREVQFETVPLEPSRRRPRLSAS